MIITLVPINVLSATDINVLSYYFAACFHNNILK